MATALGFAVLVPAFALLYVLDQKSLLPGEGIPAPTEHAETDAI